MSKTKEKKAKPKYSDFGLDDVKRNKDKGTAGTYFCAFDGWDENFGAPGHNVSSGFSFCFSNFCICPDCVAKSFLPENETRWYIDDCFKCKKKDANCYHDTDDGDIATVCESCMQWAAEVLKIETNEKSYNMAKKNNEVIQNPILPTEGDHVRIMSGAGMKTGKTGILEEIKNDGTCLIRLDKATSGADVANHFCSLSNLELLPAEESFRVGSSVVILSGKHKDKIGLIIDQPRPALFTIKTSPEGDVHYEVPSYNNSLKLFTIPDDAKQLILNHKNSGGIVVANNQDGVEVQGIKLLHIPLLQISEDPNQPRKTFDDKAVHELADSIKQQGVLQPILVRPDADGFMIVCGERRYRASLIAGLETIPATVRDLTDDEALEIQITENLQRKDVDPLEEAESFLVMIDKMGYSAADIAAKIGKDEKFVVRRLKINGLIPELKTWMKDHVLPIGHAERLAILDHKVQSDFYQNRVDYGMDGYTLKSLIGWITSFGEKKLSNANFDIHLPNYIEGTPACTACNFNTSVYSLFADKEEGICTNRKCFLEKSEKQRSETLVTALADPKILLVNSEYWETDYTKALKAEGHSVVGYQEFDRLYEPKEPAMEELDREDFDSDEEYEEVLSEAKDDFVTAQELYKDHLEKFNNSIKAFDTTTGSLVSIALRKSYLSKSKIDPSAAMKISELQSKKKRGLELDQEKIMRKLVDHMTENIPDGNLTEAEFYCIYVDYLNRIGYGQKSDNIKEKFGIEKHCYSSSDGKNFLERVSEQGSEELAKMVRISLMSNYSAIFPESLSGAIVFHLAKIWCPDILKTAELEQQESRIKREARIDSQIKELEKEVD